MKLPYYQIFFIFVILLILSPATLTSATDKEDLSSEDLHKERMALYLKTEAETSIPWFYFAGIDSYERSLRQAKKDLPEEEGLIAIYYSEDNWSGELNPNKQDTTPKSIAFFGGKGLDGNEDGRAERTNDEDVLHTFAVHMNKYGSKESSIRAGLWDFYQRDKAVELILGHASVYREIDSLDVSKRAFPVPLHFNYSYRTTWGNARGWGGKRIHEGTDIFAGHSTPVRATTYGIVELKGWNKYGGWRVGIRDTSNVYHYFAHLSSFEQGMERGTVVEPGDVIGYVGSSGYGKEGTQGKFPPHLHYGMYKDSGYTEWSFDPYPSLRVWERAERKQGK
ncbi:M23 family metallopeptidase [Salipaludibacillus sp. CF4.18]|uniref:M23 family metallopeptidase n=1 Tax=Salipaludibacillus sp. CF4.18 TaxID=3373081 RepID=UPI003EE45284